jgi:hypothetical protein
MPRKLEIDGETADKITLLNLKEYRSYLNKELKEYKKGGWLHPNDVDSNIKAIEALNLIIKHFGG